MFLDLVEDLLQDLQIFIKGLGIDSNIIYIDMHGFPNEIIENLIYHPLEDSRSIAESKGHPVKVVMAPGC